MACHDDRTDSLDAPLTIGLSVIMLRTPGHVIKSHTFYRKVIQLLNLSFAPSSD